MSHTQTVSPTSSTPYSFKYLYRSPMQVYCHEIIILDVLKLQKFNRPQPNVLTGSVASTRRKHEYIYLPPSFASKKSGRSQQSSTHLWTADHSPGMNDVRSVGPQMIVNLRYSEAAHAHQFGNSMPSRHSRHFRHSRHSRHYRSRTSLHLVNPNPYLCAF